MRRSVTLALLTMFLLSGCAAAIHHEALPADHPANPSADAATMPLSPNTLARNSDTPGGETGMSPLPQSVGPKGDMGEMDHSGHHMKGPAAPVTTYTCPMHKEVVAAAPGKCPKCQMKLVIKKEQP